MNPTVDFSQIPLRDIHLPAPIAWWPPAWGWWVLAALVLGAVVLAGLHYYDRRHHRAALRALRRLRTALEQGAESVLCLAQLSTVLRRFVMTTAPVHGDEQQVVPGLVGERWLDYLDSRWERDVFRHGDGRLLVAGPYGRPGSTTREDALRLLDLCNDWLHAQPARGGRGLEVRVGKIGVRLRFPLTSVRRRVTRKSKSDRDSAATSSRAERQSRAAASSSRTWESRR